VIYLSQPLRDVEAILRDVRVRWWASMGIALLLSGTMGLVLSGAIARPVRHLTAAAAAVARGRLEERVPVGSDDDLGRLSQAFNDMVDRLQGVLQMQADFVANVSHELRTPLTSVKGLIETLRDGAVDDQVVRDRFLETIEGETNRLIRLVNELLLLSRLDSDALTLRREAVDVVQLAEAATEELAARAEEEQVALALAAGADVPRAWADPDRLTQVLLNLLDNAIKYSAPGGVVTVDVRGVGRGLVQIEVRDHGMGIPATSLPRVGERFYRVDRARSRNRGGSGLGLAIAKALVAAQRGRLTLESREGQGTIVTVLLPQHAPEEH
jgi:signal transduction histidine kinase